MVDFDIAEDGDPQPPEPHGNEAHTESYATAADAIDTRRAVNQLVVQNAEQDFELGLDLLDYRDGQYEAFANGVNIRSSDKALTKLGSPTVGRGFARVADEYVGGAPLSQTNSSAAGDGEATGIVATEDHIYVSNLDERIIKFDRSNFSTSGQFTDAFEVLNGLAYEDGFLYAFGPNSVYRVNSQDMTEDQSYTPDISPTAVGVQDGFGYWADNAGQVKKFEASNLSAGPVDTYSTGVSPSPDMLKFEKGNGYVSGLNTQLRRFNTADMVEEAVSGFGSDYDIGQYDIGLSADHVYISGVDTVYELEKQTLSETGRTFVPQSGEFLRGIATVLGFGYVVNEDSNEIVEFDLSDMTGTGNSFGGHVATPTAIDVTPSGGFSSGGTSFDATLRGWASVDPATEASVSHVFTDLGFVPSNVVVNHDIDLPSGGGVNYTIEDNDGNIVSIPLSDVDTVVDLSSITNSTVSVTVIMSRPTTEDDSPEVDGWAAYFTN